MKVHALPSPKYTSQGGGIYQALQHTCSRQMTKTYPISSYEASDPRGEMDHVATRVIYDTPLEQKPATPQTEGAHSIRESEPQRHKKHPGAEIHSTQHGTRQQHQRDGGEDELKVNHSGHGVQRHDSASFHAPIMVMNDSGRQICLRQERLV